MNTPTPYRLNEHNGRYGIEANDPERKGCVVEITDRIWDKDNAAFIVRACNSHADLLEALEPFATLFTCPDGDVQEITVKRSAVRPLVVAARAVIARATGQEGD